MRTCARCSATYTDEVNTCSQDGEALPDPDLAVGTTVGEYRIEGRLGSGAFGSVFRAVHPVIGKRVAIKVLNRQFSANPEMVSRFVSEARAVNQIGHKNIIDIFAFGQLPDGRQYYVMELLRGVTLDRYLQDRGRLIMEEAVPILRGVGRALDAAHKAGIAHRDLKPANVLVADDDGRAFPKLLDFGIAKLMLSSDGAQHRTRTGTPMGTPFYMSPEQCRGRDVDHRTDIYSFGVMTYELLTGRRPFVGDDFLEIITKQVGAEAVPPSQIWEDIPPDCDEAIAWMMRKDPAARAPTVGAAVEALERAAAAFGVSVHSNVTRLTAEQRSRLASTMGQRNSGALIAQTVMGTGTEPGATKGFGTKPPGTKPGTNPPETSPPGTSPPGASSHGIPAAAVPAPQTLGSTIVAAELQSGPPPRRRVGLMALVALAALSAVVAVVVVVSHGGEGSDGGASGTSASAATTPSPTPATVPTPPPATAPAPPSAPTAVVITVAGTDGADVFDANHKKLATIPGTLELPRGNVAIVLRAEKAGFMPGTATVTPSSDGTVSLALAPIPAIPVKPTVPVNPVKPEPETPVVVKPPEPPKKKSGLPDF